MGETEMRYLEAIGIPVFRLRGTDPAATTDKAATTGPAATPDKVATADTASTAATASWDELADQVRTCTQCVLHKTRTQTVFGIGNRNADLMIIGEAPGADEDRQGEPFVGRAGQLLNAMLRAIGLGRDTVFIANILKCRPPDNRDPSPTETACCTPYLERQIALVAPRVVLAVGRIASQHLLQSDQAIGRLRGKALTFGAKQTPIVATYHPAYLLRSPLAKSKAWQDLVLVKQLISERQ